MLAVADRLLSLRVNIEQTLHTTATDDVLLDDFHCILGLDLRIEGIIRDNFHDRALLAKAEATGSDNINLVCNTILFESSLKVFNDFMAV